MAELKASLQQLVECPICFEVFAEPRALPCLHNLCASCLQQASTWPSNIKCPFCNKLYKTRDAKPDFRTQQLVDLYMTLDLGIGFSNLSDDRDPSGGEKPPGGGSGGSGGDGIREIQLAEVFSISPPENSRITSMLVLKDVYCFVLNTGQILKHKPGKNWSKCFAVRDKQHFTRGVVGGAIAGLVASPFGPVAAVAAAVSTFAVSSNILGSSHVTQRYRVELLTRGQRGGRLVALCESRQPREDGEKVLLELNEQCVVEGRLSGCGDHVTRLHGNQAGDTVYATTHNGRSMSAWSRRGDGSWLTHSLSTIRHAHSVQMCVDDTHCYTLDDQSVYMATRASSQLVSAHNLPAVYSGRLSLLAASQGRVLLWDTFTRALCTLNTGSNTWTRVHVPDATCRPLHAALNDDLRVHVLCTRVRGGECTVYTCQL